MNTLNRILELLTDVDPAMLALVVCVFTGLEATVLIGLVVPGDIVFLLASSTAGTPGRTALVFAAATVGTFLAELGGYTLGRYVGPQLRTSWLGRRIGEARWDRAEAYLAGRGAHILVPVRFVSVLHAIAPLVAGTTRMPLRRFVFWSGLGAVTWSATYTAIGALAGHTIRSFGQVGLVSSAVALSGIGAGFLVKRHRQRRRQARAAQAPRVALTARAESPSRYDCDSAKRSAVPVAEVVG